jgi:Protein of unknown function (DUF664)
MTQPRTGGEKQILSVFLDQQRDVVLWKLDGLTDDQLRQPITPSGLYLLGLVKHLAGADRHPALASRITIHGATGGATT